MSSASWPELAGTLFPPISRPRSSTSVLLASGMTVSVLMVDATAFRLSAGYVRGHRRILVIRLVDSTHGDWGVAPRDHFGRAGRRRRGRAARPSAIYPRRSDN